MKTEAAAAETRDLDPVEFAARARFPLPSTLIEAMMANKSEALAHVSSVWTNYPLFQPKGWQPPVAFSTESLLFSQALRTSGLLDSRAYLGVNILSPIVCLSPFFPLLYPLPTLTPTPTPPPSAICTPAKAETRLSHERVMHNQWTLLRPYAPLCPHLALDVAQAAINKKSTKKTQ